MPKRKDGRAHDALRPVEIRRSFTQSAPGSVLISAGKTVVLCTAQWTDSVPQWLIGSGHGWLTAEYSMLPGSTRNRKPREARIGRADGRSLEIQRLIGRCLRMAVNVKKLPEISLWVDCDVLSADGGTRTTAITGAFVAVHDLLKVLEDQKRLTKWPIKQPVAACSVGIVNGEPRLDLNFDEDSQAEVDMNVAMMADGTFAEVQASAERAPLSRDALGQMTELAEHGCAELLELQHRTLSDASA